MWEHQAEESCWWTASNPSKTTNISSNETVNGNKYIITLTDYFSKWAEAAPLPSKHAAGVAKSSIR